MIANFKDKLQKFYKEENRLKTLEDWLNYDLIKKGLRGYNGDIVIWNY